MTKYWCELAWLGSRAAERGVVLSVEGERITSVESGVAIPPPGSVTLAGLSLPGLANGHSHAFHRALRGHTHAGAGSFWTWREQMYDVAERLDPENYHRLARATFAEMVVAGICVVGEFHYVHHQPDGRPYDDSNAMGYALLAAAADAGIRVYTVSVGAGADTVFMEELATIGNGEHYYAGGGSIDSYSAGLTAIFEALGGKWPVVLVK